MGHSPLGHFGKFAKAIFYFLKADKENTKVIIHGNAVNEKDALFTDKEKLIIIPKLLQYNKALRHVWLFLSPTNQYLRHSQLWFFLTIWEQLCWLDNMYQPSPTYCHISLMKNFKHLALFFFFQSRKSVSWNVKRFWDIFFCFFYFQVQ